MVAPFLVVATCVGRVGPVTAQVASVASQPAALYGIAYGQFRTGQSPDLGIHPSRAEIAEDLQHLRRLTDRIRLYGLVRSGAVVVEEASKLGFRILAGVWLSDDVVSNEAEITAAVELARRGLPGIEAFIVGSEVLLRQELPPDTLASLIRRVRDATDYRVAYAETAAIWNSGDPSIERVAQEVDLIITHIYPFWDSVSIQNASTHYEETLAQVRRSFPGKPVVVGETGWPARGPARGPAVPSPSNQAEWLQYVLGRSHADSVYFFSAFSEDWKDEAGVGSSWGILTSSGEVGPEILPLLARHGVRPDEVAFQRADGSRDAGDTQEALWNAFNRGDHQGVEVVAARIIERDSAFAKAQEQADARGPQLDAVGLAYFLLGRSKETRGDVTSARAAYRTVVDRYSRAMAWDPQGWWWSIAAAARERLPPG